MRSNWGIGNTGLEKIENIGSAGVWNRARGILEKLGFYFICCAVMLSACKQVQIIQLKSDLKKDNYFVFENDSIKISYDFWHEGGLVAFSVFNKLSVPIYIDWKKSSFISNQEKLNYFSEVTQEVRVSNGGYYYRGPLMAPGYSSTSASVMYKKERITFIPPKSYYYRSDFLVMPGQYFDLSDEPTIKIPKTTTRDTTKKTKAKREVFQKESSPRTIRNFLTYSLTEDFRQEIFIDNSFWISEILQVKLKQFRGRKKSEFNYEYPFYDPTRFYITPTGQ